MMLFHSVSIKRYEAYHIHSKSSGISLYQDCAFRQGDQVEPLS